MHETAKLPQKRINTEIKDSATEVIKTVEEVGRKGTSVQEVEKQNGSSTGNALREAPRNQTRANFILK